MPSKKLKTSVEKRSSNVESKTLTPKLAKKTLAKSKVNKKTVTAETFKKTETLKKTGEQKISLRAEVYDTNGKVVEKINLPKEIFGAKINKPLLSQAVRVYLANQRLGTAKTKDRGEVHGSTRKIWQQKGTGRARHGSKRAPIFVHGGIAFGPRPRDYSLNLSKKMKTAALFSALSSRLKDQKIKIVDGLEKITPKTKIMTGALKNLGLSDNQKILLIISSSKDSLQNIQRAARNIEGIEIANSSNLNAYRILDNKSILLMKTAIDAMESNFLKNK